MLHIVGTRGPRQKQRLWRHLHADRVIWAVCSLPRPRRRPPTSLRTHRLPGARAAAALWVRISRQGQQPSLGNNPGDPLAEAIGGQGAMQNIAGKRGQKQKQRLSQHPPPARVIWAVCSLPQPGRGPAAPFAWIPRRCILVDPWRRPLGMALLNLMWSLRAGAALTRLTPRLRPGAKMAKLPRTSQGRRPRWTRSQNAWFAAALCLSTTNAMLVVGRATWRGRPQRMPRSEAATTRLPGASATAIPTTPTLAGSIISRTSRKRGRNPTTQLHAGSSTSTTTTPMPAASISR
ncbi:unnamed protein product [Prorocentrum cordatum]|uniref:Uncharacterized protein n=1 Tax=Prorocentrum cordatum TaxID=2364126 RepID=A0ABN9VZW3_9DINO|nr:unnamed protein product [Polarella glacialis]